MQYSLGVGKGLKAFNTMVMAHTRFTDAPKRSIICSHMHQSIIEVRPVKALNLATSNVTD